MVFDFDALEQDLASDGGRVAELAPDGGEASGEAECGSGGNGQLHGRSSTFPAFSHECSLLERDLCTLTEGLFKPEIPRVGPSGPSLGADGFLLLPGQDAFSGRDAEAFPADDLEVCKCRCRDWCYGGFAVWKGMAYFRRESAAECAGHLVASPEADLYLNCHDRGAPDRPPPSVRAMPTAADFAAAKEARLEATDKAAAAKRCASGLASGKASQDEVEASRAGAAQAQAAARALEAKTRILVSVICPTGSSRRCFHSFLWDVFCSQTHEPRELIVVETCPEGPSEFWQARARHDARLVYRHFPVSERSWSVGLKRNLACCLAAGQVIAHFDDDDIYAPSYLSTMVSCLLEPSRAQLARASDPAAERSTVVQEVLGPAGAACAKLASWFKFNARFGLWSFCDPCRWPSRRVGFTEQDVNLSLYGWGFSFVYLRSAWLLCPFPHRQIGEDYDFLQAIRQIGFPVVLFRDTEGLCAHTQHSENTSGRQMEFAEPLTQEWKKIVLERSPLVPLLERHRNAVDALRAAQNLPQYASR